MFFLIPAKPFSFVGLELCYVIFGLLKDENNK